MKVHFYSISSNDKLDYISDLEYKNDTYIFKDMVLENTINYFKILDKHIDFKREGDTVSIMSFILNEKTSAYYCNNLGLEFDFYIYTKRLDIKNTKISIEYDLIIDNEVQDTVKIYLIIK